MTTVYRLPTTEWKHQAECRGRPADWWHPPHDAPTSTRNRLHAFARTLCNICPVQTECLAHAIVNHETDGMWGGQTPKQRSRISRTVDIQYPCSACSTLIRHPARGRRIRTCAPCRARADLEYQRRYNRTKRTKSA